MILRRAPEEAHGERAATTPSRYDGSNALYQKIWSFAEAALREVDPEYAANNWSALAVTKNFRGSPHIDKQNRGPFYGLAVGNYPEGRGGVCVETEEAGGRVVARVNTKNRLGKIDGRFVHWVDAWDGPEVASEDESGTNFDRYSLIFYQTLGDSVPKTTAVFPDPLADAPVLDVIETETVMMPDLHVSPEHFVSPVSVPSTTETPALRKKRLEQRLYQLGKDHPEFETALAELRSLRKERDTLPGRRRARARQHPHAS